MATIINQSNLSYQYKINPTGASQTKTITSNSVSTNLITAGLGITKTVDKSYATIGDTLTYTLVLKNSGNILLSDIVLKDVIPTGASFVSGSVKVDNVAQPTYNIVTGINLGNLIILGSKTVTFQVTISSLPNPNTIRNVASATYNYLVTSLISGTATSNIVTTTIHVPNVTMVKEANVTDVEAGDEITYTIILTNSGNIDATDITFTDPLDPQLTFVTGSVTIDGTTKPGYDPNTGFTIPTIVPNATTTITFKATVN